MRGMVEQMALPASTYTLADSFGVLLATSDPIGALPTTHYTTKHPHSSPKVATHTNLPCSTRANSANAELISPTAAVAPEFSTSDGSCGTQLCRDPSRSVTPESIRQPLDLSTRKIAADKVLSTELEQSVFHVPPPTTPLGGFTTTIFNNSRNAACPTATWRRAQHFIKVITHSPLIASALAALDVAGHPSVGDEAPSADGDGDSLCWTLAAMLALFLQSNLPSVTEESLLAMLWTMESWSDARRSPATLVLGDYLRHLAAFDPDRAETMGATWRDSFCALRSAVVDAQVELLHSLEWNVRLRDGAILYCHRLLFGALPVSSSSSSNVAEGSTAAAVAAAAAAEAEAWSAAAAAASKHRAWRDPSGACADQVNALCACVVAQSSRISASEARKARAAAAAVVVQKKRAASPSGSEKSSYDSAPPVMKRQRYVTAERISFRSSQ